jgi:hypothetical protein
MKQCNKCSSLKPLTEFYKNHKAPDGKAYACKTCANAAVKQWAGQNREKAYAYQKTSRTKNIEHYNEKSREWARANPEKAVEKTKRWTAKNMAVKLAHTAARRAQKLKATPAWANRERIQALYSEMAQWNKANPDNPVHVDHIVPLVSNTVCGLHCEQNLRIIHSTENYSKGNRYWPDMP